MLSKPPACWSLSRTKTDPSLLLHLNPEAVVPVLSASSATGGGAAPPKMPLENNIIEFAGQYIAVVVANSLEGAQHAANLIRVAYIEDDPVIEWADKRAQKIRANISHGRASQKC